MTTGAGRCKHSTQSRHPARQAADGAGDLQHGGDVGDLRARRRLTDEADDAQHRLGRDRRYDAGIRRRSRLPALLLRRGPNVRPPRPHQPDEHRPVEPVVAGKQADVEDRQVAGDEDARRDLVFDAKQEASLDGGGNGPCLLAPPQATEERASQAVHHRASPAGEASAPAAASGRSAERGALPRPTSILSISRAAGSPPSASRRRR